MHTPGFRLIVLCLGAVLLAGGQAAVFGTGEPGNKPTEPVEPDRLKEQTVYVPYEKLREVFERDGRGVFLPYDAFQQLWQAASELSRRPTDIKPPVEALVAEATSEAEIAGDVMLVAATLEIEILTKGWHEVPLRLSDSVVTSAMLNGEPTRLIAGADGYGLLVEKTTPEPQRYQLRLTYAKAFTKSPGRNTVSFEAPQAPVNHWRVRIPEREVQVQLHPLIATTEKPSHPSAADETVVMAFVGAAPSVQIDWVSRAEGATGMMALASVETVERVSVREGVIRTTAQVTYDIRRSALSQLVIDVPADQKVVNVFNANIRKWSVEGSGPVQRITAELFEPAQGTQGVTVELERFIEFQGAMELAAPVVAAVDVGRQHGIVGIEIADELRADPVRWAGLSQTDVADVPKSAMPDLTAATLLYRFDSVPFDLTVRVEKTEPSITVNALADVQLNPQSINIQYDAELNIERSGVFEIEMEIPPKFDFVSARGIRVADAEPIAVESSRAGGDDGRRLVIQLSRRALGRVGLSVILNQKLDADDLAKPMGRAVDVSAAAPRLVGSYVEQAQGQLIVRVPESLRVNVLGSEGLRSIPSAELNAGSTGPSAKKLADGDFAFEFGDEATALTLRLERRKPYVTARQLLLVQVEPGVVKHAATFFYEIRYSGVDSLRIDVPQKLIGRLHCDTKGVRESVIEPPPEDVAEGYVALRLVGDSGLSVNPTIQFSYESRLDSFEVGESQTLQVPQLRAIEVDRAWGQIAVTGAESIDVRTADAAAGSTKGLRPIDPRHDLMAGAAALGATDAARAFEFHDDWSLTLLATRYKLEEVKRTSIERAYVRMVATRSDQLSVHALYRMRSAHQRLAVHLPGGAAFDPNPVRINGRPAVIERGKTDEFFIPLVGQDPDTPLLLEVRYTLPKVAGQWSLPSFPSEPAVQKVYVSAFLPSERILLGSRGPWTNEMRWHGDGAFSFRPLPVASDNELLNWVREGVAGTGGSAEPFQTDGKPYLFSSLQPPASPGGDLALTTIDENWFKAIVIVSFLAVGLGLLRTSPATRILSVGAFLTAATLCGVFLPTFSRQMLNLVFMYSILVVLLIWLAHYFAWIRPHDPAVIARKQERERVRLARIRAGMPQPAVATAVAATAATPQGAQGGEHHG